MRRASTQTRSLNDVEAVDLNALGTQIGALGIVKSFDSEKGSGFIVPDNGPDVYVHSSALKTAGLTRLEAGQRVEFKRHARPARPAGAGRSRRRHADRQRGLRHLDRLSHRRARVRRQAGSSSRARRCARRR